MKKITLFLTVLLLTTAGISAEETSVIGSWLLTTVEEDGKTEELYAEITFKDDGYAEWDGRVFGKWEHNKKTFTIESEMIKEFAAEWKVSKFKNGELVLTKPGSKLSFIRLDKTKIEEENKNSGLEGMWKVEKVVLKAPDEVAEEAPEESANKTEKTLSFNLPDTYKGVESSIGRSSSYSGTWMYNDAEKSLIVQTSDRSLRGLNHVVKLTDTALVLENRENIVTAKKVEASNIEVIRLEFTEDDFYDEDGDFKYDADAEKLPWQDFSRVVESLGKIKQLKYSFAALNEDIGDFEIKTLTANIVTVAEEGIIDFDNIFKGIDRTSFADEEEMPIAYSNPENRLFPFEDNSFRVTGTEEITTPAGTFECTVIETTEGFDERIKLWMINDKPGVFAKAIKDLPGSFGHYWVFELAEIK